MKIKAALKEDLKKYLKDRLKRESEKVVITTAQSMNDAELKKILGHLPNAVRRKVEKKVDPEILAGFVIRIGSYVYDYSLSGIVNNLKKISHEIH